MGTDLLDKGDRPLWWTMGTDPFGIGQESPSVILAWGFSALVKS